MFHAVLKIAVKSIYKTFVACKRLKRDRVDELCSVLSHQHLHVCALFFEHTGKVGYLISGDAA